MQTRPLTLLLLAAMTACAAEGPEPAVDLDDVADNQAAIWMNPKLKGAKIVASISTWRRDLEAQLQLAQRPRLEDPVITAIAPSTVNRGQAITITGRNFTRMTWLGQSYAVSFQAGQVRSLAAATSMTSTQIVVTVPANATTGQVRLVNTSAGNAIWAESPLPLTVNVPVPTTGTVRFTNDSQYEVHSLVVNGQERIPVGQVLPPVTGWVEIVAPGATLPFTARLGFGGFTMLEFQGSATFVNGQTATLSIRRVLARDVLTLGASYAWFDGPWYDANLAPHAASLKIYDNGTYDLYSDNVYIGTAGYTDGAFNPGSSVVSMTINGENIGFDFPYASFSLHNGPPEWPQIDYVRR